MTSHGHRVGPFELLERTASSQQTSLYRAARPDNSRPPRQVAIRIANNPDDANAAAFIVREYETLREMHDPRFPKAYGHYAGQAALAMSWCDGVTLTDIIQAQADGFVEIEPVTALDILIEVGAALRHAHAVRTRDEPVVHGHLGSQRIMLNSNGDVIVLGLGREPVGYHISYMPPEQAAGAFIDWRSDQWALGAIGVELLLGEKLYTGAANGKQAAIEGQTSHWVKELERRWPMGSRPIRKALSVAAGDRFQQETELLRALMASRRELGGLANRRSLARSVMAFRDRLTVQRPGALTRQRPVQPVDAPTQNVDETITSKQLDIQDVLLPELNKPAVGTDSMDTDSVIDQEHDEGTTGADSDLISSPHEHSLDLMPEETQTNTPIVPGATDHMPTPSPVSPHAQPSAHPASVAIPSSHEDATQPAIAEVREEGMFSMLERFNFQPEEYIGMIAAIVFGLLSLVYVLMLL